MGVENVFETEEGHVSWKLWDLKIDTWIKNKIIQDWEFKYQE